MNDAAPSFLLLQLQQERQTLDELLSLIVDEQRLLMHNQINDIQVILEKKSRHIAQLAQLTQQRYQLLSQQGYPANETGMQLLLEQQSDAIVIDAWQQLLDRVLHAKQLNHTNGLIINTQLNRNRNALNVLAGAGVLDNLYGANGQTHLPQVQRGHVIG